jgi:hypothetical protein
MHWVAIAFQSVTAFAWIGAAQPAARQPATAAALCSFIMCVLPFELLSWLQTLPRMRPAEVFP